MRVLVTGAAGYIGSHTCVQLLEKGYQVAALDNLSNSKEEALRRVTQLAGKAPRFHRVDLVEEDELEKVFAAEAVDAVIHFAGLKAVGESVEQPLHYYHNNLVSTLALCRVMQRHGVKDLIFSSSCTVYGDPEELPLHEDMPLGAATNPYGRTKQMIEQILRDLQAADPAWNITLLRYFNPVGAHPSGRIGEDPAGIPNNLMPYITQVAVGKLEQLSVYGNDYPTPDGSCIRDYIHVVDLAAGHLKALEQLAKKPGLGVYNLGTGRGYSVLEVIEAFARASGRPIPHRIVGRRPGDAVAAYADPARARQELGWEAQLDIDAMCADAWRWQQANPEGF